MAAWFAGGFLVGATVASIALGAKLADHELEASRAARLRMDDDNARAAAAATRTPRPLP